MVARSPVPRLTDIVEAIERVRSELSDVSSAAFEGNWRIRWVVERGIEIISGASRHLPQELKTRHPEIPWRSVAGIGNVLRHNYENLAPPITWALVREGLPALDVVCREELAREQAHEQD